MTRGEKKLRKQLDRLLEQRDRKITIFLDEEDTEKVIAILEEVRVIYDFAYKIE